jgi:pimeloyl-ACP methyl ester carboxylesterase
MSWFRYDPPEVLAGLRLPVLLVHGSADVQVDVGDARSLQASKPGAKLAIVEGMDHLLALQGDIGGGTQRVATQVADWLEELDVRVAA